MYTDECRNSCTSRINHDSINPTKIETIETGVTHIGSHEDYEWKASVYRLRAGFCLVLEKNPLNEIDLKTRKQILLAFQYEKMLPNRDTIELSYMYFLPKAHQIQYTEYSIANHRYSKIAWPSDSATISKPNNIIQQGLVVQI